MYAKFFTITVSALAFVFFINIFTLQKEVLFAGKIIPKEGIVEIVRNGEVILVQTETELKIGDVVKIGNNAEADLNFPDHFNSVAKPRTKFQVIDENTIFLQKGVLLNKSLGEDGEISTDRGFVRGNIGASFNVEVSDSGETRIVSKKSQVTVFDWKDGHAILDAGEEVKLRTDTALTYEEVPEDLKLSRTQIMAIRSKLVITRTKILNALEEQMIGNETESEDDLKSAKGTYRSIIQVIAASRDLEISKRKSMDLVDIEDVYLALKEKTSDNILLAESKALESLFSILEANKNNFAFLVTPTDVTSFDRFVLLDRIIQLGTTVQKDTCDILKQKYVEIFLRKIQDEPLKIDQIILINREIAKLPKNALARDFLIRLSELLPPDLQAILNEKIENSF